MMDWDDVWVFGSWVPRRRDAVGAVTGVGLLLLIAAVHRRIVLTRGGAIPRKRWWLRVIGARLSTTGVLVVTLPLSLFVAWLDGWDTFRVLQPASADSCRVVVQESDSSDSRQFGEGLRLPLGHGTGAWSCPAMSPVA